MKRGDEVSKNICYFYGQEYDFDEFIRLGKIKRIDFSKYFNKDDFDVLRKLKIPIEKRLYSVNELYKFFTELIEYIDLKENGLRATKSLKEKNVPKEHFDRILNTFFELTSEYKSFSY